MAKLNLESKLLPNVWAVPQCVTELRHPPSADGLACPTGSFLPLLLKTVPTRSRLAKPRLPSSYL